VQAVGERVSTLGKLAGVKLSMKSLRRGFGCYWAGRVPAQVLQKMMRHYNISLTMTYYANVDDAVAQAILSREPSIDTKRNTLRNSEAAETTAQGQESASNSDI
jgi:integrase